MNKPEQLQPNDLSSILFAAAVAQGRADALKAAAVKAAKDLAYAETHAKMLASFKRDADRRRALADDKTQDEVDAEMLRDFDAAEARAINVGRM